MSTGTLYIVSAASGTGKTSLLKALLEKTTDIAISVSHTTRDKRPGEESGVHYHYVTKDTFVDLIGKGDFL
jgi:guanylate kinase